MAALTDYVEQKILEQLVAKTAWTMPVNVFVALSTTTPTEAGGNFTEPVGAAYARKQTVGADWTTGVAGAMDNAAAIAFAQATGSWGTVTHFGIYDALTAGNLLAWAALTTAKTIGNGDTASFAIGALDLTLD